MANQISRRELLAGIGALAAGASVLAVPGTAGADTRFPLPASSTLTVLLTGDAGTGTAEQYAVARAARAICAREGVNLAVGLGDNIYEDGPESADDDEFATKFEQPNAGIDVPWLMVLGNHDTSGIIPGSGGRPSRGDHEVAYHWRSRRWYMPSRYYKVALPAGSAAPVAEFFGIDTTPLASYVMQTDPYYAWDGQYAREQRAWLDAALAASQARWKIVFAHHPLRNNGRHGNAGSYDGVSIGHYWSGVHVRELYEQVVCGRADFILSGHDHTLQLLDTGPKYGGTQQIICGASAKKGDGSSVITTPAHWQDFASHGFMVMKIDANSVAVDAYTVDVATASATLAHTQITHTAS